MKKKYKIILSSKNYFWHVILLCMYRWKYVVLAVIAHGPNMHEFHVFIVRFLLIKIMWRRTQWSKMLLLCYLLYLIVKILWLLQKDMKGYACEITLVLSETVILFAPAIAANFLSHEVNKINITSYLKKKVFKAIFLIIQ